MTDQEKEEMELCKGYGLSNCCDAPIVMGDICSAPNCRDHCENQCGDCILNDLCDNAKIE